MAIFSSLSDVLGYTSIACWLGAQFPQVLENYRRDSVDGLAWPFLANWLLGDVSNLVGCILTHQLPFQTYLAVYFCFVDVTLVGQYIFYTFKAKPKPLPSRARTTSAATLSGRLSIERPPTHYRALSNVAANVAAAAALAAQQEEHSRWRVHHSVDSRLSHADATDDEEEDEVDEDALARLADSFHSEGGRSARKKVSWSSERRGRGGSLGRSHSRPVMSPISRVNPSLPIPTSPIVSAQDPDAANRGRPLSRDIPLLDESQTEWATESSAQRRSSRASRKGASMVFLSGWALFSLGTLIHTQRSRATSELRVGRVLSADVVPAPTASAMPALQDSLSIEDSIHGQKTQTENHLSFDDLHFADKILSDPHEDGPSTDYIIGRISAWICTTLYLTSRLPQIWKNYVRKSVEGLSISLFVFAFMGNFFYVASILSSPNLGLPEPQASAFLRESIPYLLGSGGTLMFDITIVTQSFLYRGKPRSRGRSFTRAIAEEEEALLSAGATGADDSITPSRRRFPLVNDGAAE